MNRTWQFLWLALLMHVCCYAAKKEPVNCYSWDWVRLEARYQAGNGVGYQGGYTTFALFGGPNIYENTRFFPFLDVRGHIFNTGRLALNAGLGLRGVLSRSWILGGNVYYDYRHALEQEISQFAGGFELLGRWLDFRCNAYFPFKHKRVFSPLIFDHFSGNNAFLLRKGSFALPVLEGEVGGRLKRFYWAAGPYYLFHQKEGGKFGLTYSAALGGKARVSFLAWDGIRIGAQVSYDHLFRWRGSGILSLSYPLGPYNSRRKEVDRACREAVAVTARLTQDVGRFEIIPVIRKKRNDIPIIDLETGLPFHFIFVNNQSGSDGSFEDPFAALNDAERVAKERDIIIVYAGDGTTKGYDTGFNLKPFQMLHSAGLPLSLNGYEIPAFDAGRHPKVSVLGPVIINLAHGSVVRGLHLSGAYTAVQANQVKDAQVSDCTISGCGKGILAVNPMNTFRVSGNVINGNGTHLHCYNATRDCYYEVIQNDLQEPFSGHAAVFYVSSTTPPCKMCVQFSQNISNPAEVAFHNYGPSEAMHLMERSESCPSYDIQGKVSFTETIPPMNKY